MSFAFLYGHMGYILELMKELSKRHKDKRQGTIALKINLFTGYVTV